MNFNIILLAIGPFLLLIAAFTSNSTFGLPIEGIANGRIESEANQQKVIIILKSAKILVIMQNTYSQRKLIGFLK